MKLRHLFTVNLFLAACFGLACVLFPAWALRLYRLIPDAADIWMTRLAGGSILGFGTLMVFGRSTASAEARLEIQLRGRVNALGWSNPLLYGLLAFGYAWFQFARQDES